MRTAFKFTVLLWLMAFSQAPSYAFTVSQADRELSLNQDISYWEDKTGKATLPSVSAAVNAGEFVAVPSGSDVLNLGFTQSANWIRVTLNRAPTIAENWVLEIPYLGINQIDLYTPGQPPLLNGSLIPVENRPVYSRFYAFPLRLTTQPTTYYLRVKSTYPISLPIRLVEQRHFYELQTWENLFQFLYFGGLISLLIYNLILFIMIRDDKYVIYSLFTLLTGLAIFAGNGYASIYLWSDSPHWDAIAQPVLMSLAGGVGVLFSTRFLKTRRFLPKTHRALQVLIGLFTALAVLIGLSLNLPIPQPPLFQVLFLISLLTPILVSAACIRNIRYNIRSARFFLAAWGILCLGVLVAAARVFNLIPSNPLTLYAFQISSGLEMLLFSLALAYRFQSERAKRENAQNALISSQEATVRALQLSEDRLEKAVGARTEKLQQLLLSEQQMVEQYVRFGAMIAHEFRNPLNTIAAQASILEMEPETTVEKTHKRTSVIRSAVHRLTTLFDQWLESDRIRTVDNQLNLQPIRMEPWLNQLVESCRTYHDQHMITALRCPSDLTIIADDHLLQIAVINLIDNAAKYSAPGSRISVGATQVDRFLGICIRDHGCGISKAQIETVLQPYQRADQASSGVPGTGLGLAFVNRIVELHQGRIDIDSELGEGSSITLWLPISTPVLERV